MSTEPIEASAGSERVLLCARVHGRLDEPGNASLLDELSACGGELVAWRSDRCSYAFALDYSPGVVSAALALVRSRPALAVGIALGRLAFSAGRVGSVRPSGHALAASEALAACACFGEVLVDPELEARLEGASQSEGAIPVVIAGQRVDSALLVPRRRPSVSPPPKPAHGRQSMLRTRAPRKPEAPRPPRPEREASRIRPSYQSLLPLRAALRRSAQWAAGQSLGSPPPKPTGARVDAPPLNAIERLQRGHVSDLRQLLRAGASAGTQERIGALVAIVEGRSQAGLEQLEAAASLAASRQQREASRALLAYALGLAVTQRSEEALLQGLLALAHARAWNDPTGERASVSLLAQLAANADQEDAAAEWQAVAAALSPGP